MRLQAADEPVGLLGQAEPARVVGRVALEDVLTVLPEAHVEVAAVAGEVTERLRHEGRDQPALLGERLDHVAEEDGAVAGGERVGELEVLLELAVRVLVVVRVVVPAELRHVARDLRHEVEVARERAHVVTGLVERVERVGELDRAVVGHAHEEVLELRAEHELVSERARPLELAAQDRARAVGPLLALDVHVACEARDVRLPRQRGERADVGHRGHVGVVRLLADGAGRHETSGSEVTSISPSGLRTATAQVETPRIITPSSTAWPPTGASREATGMPSGIRAPSMLGPPLDDRRGSAAVSHGRAQPRLLRAALRLKRSTRPPVSTSFCLPV